MIRILEATTEELRLSALRLRYEIFSRECGDDRYSDHARQVWIDRDDGPQSRVMVAVNDQDIVIGTARFTRLRDWAFIAHEVFNFPLLAEVVGLSEEQLQNSLCRWDRVVVAKAYRGTYVLPMLEARFCQLGRETDCLIGVGIVSVSNHLAHRVFVKLGWSDYPVIAPYNGFTAQLIYKDLRVPSSGLASLFDSPATAPSQPLPIVPDAAESGEG